MNQIVVIKENIQRQETWRYPADVIETRPNAVLLEASFNRNDMDVHGMTMARGDRFVEVYYSDRWYNIYEIYSRDDNHLRGWYANVCLPAQITPSEVHYVDLALDLLVFPDGCQLVLDEDEFEALDLPESTRARALEALEEMKKIFTSPIKYRVLQS